MPKRSDVRAYGLRLLNQRLHLYVQN
jgi:hypothetical protein